MAKRRAKYSLGPLYLVIALGIGIGITWWSFARVIHQPLPPTAYFVAQKGDLRISVNEQGELKALVDTPVRDDMNYSGGSAAASLVRIISLKPEGSFVQKDEQVAQLDSSDLKDQVNQEELNFQDQKLAFEISEDNLKIQASQVQSDLDAAQLKIVNAQVDLEQYRDATAPQQIKTMEQNLGVQKKDLENSREHLTNTISLFAQGYQTASQEKTDRLSLNSKEIQYTRAEETLRLFHTFDYPKRMQQLEANFENAKNELVRLTDRSKAQLDQAAADHRTAKISLDTLETSLNMHKQQLANAIIRAPVDGVVVYARPSRSSQSGANLGGLGTPTTTRGGRGQQGGGGGATTTGGGGRGTGTARGGGGGTARGTGTTTRNATTGGRGANASTQLQGGAVQPSTVMEEGALVRYRQTIMTIPDLTKMVAMIKVPEAQVRLLRTGLTAHITVDTLPGQIFTGTVTRVNNVADSQAAFENPNRRVYQTDVLIDDELPMLKPGVTARAEIVVAIVLNVISVPTQAIFRVGGQQVCYVLDARDFPKPVVVQMGTANDSFTEITSGLKEGDRVMLAPPEGTETEQTNAVAGAKSATNAAPAKL